jgi:hypothetical protein
MRNRNRLLVTLDKLRTKQNVRRNIGSLAVLEPKHASLMLLSVRLKHVARDHRYLKFSGRSQSLHSVNNPTTTVAPLADSQRPKGILIKVLGDSVHSRSDDSSLVRVGYVEFVYVYFSILCL